MFMHLLLNYFVQRSLDTYKQRAFAFQVIELDTLTASDCLFTHIRLHHGVKVERIPTGRQINILFLSKRLDFTVGTILSLKYQILDIISITS